MNYFKKLFCHLRTITKHKLLVMKYCFKLGLFKQGLLHDNSKYSPIEFFTSVKYYSGTRSPIDAEKEDKGYSLVWQHHKGHNPHHWEYWIDNIGPVEVKERTVYETSTGEKIPIVAKHLRSNPTALEIPINYVLEMICDWISAGQTYLGDKWTCKEPYSYYKKFESSRIINENSKKIIENILISIKDYGIDYTFYKIKNNFGIFIDNSLVYIGKYSWKSYMKSLKKKN